MQMLHHDHKARYVIMSDLSMPRRALATWAGLGWPWAGDYDIFFCLSCKGTAEK